MIRFYMKAPEYIMLLDKKPSWRAIIFIFRNDNLKKYIHVGSVMRGKYVFLDHFVLKFIRDYRRGVVTGMSGVDVLEPNTFKLKDAKDKVFVHVVHELTKYYRKTEYGKLLYKSPGNKGYILRAVVDRNMVLQEMYNCMTLPLFWERAPWDELYVTASDVWSGELDAYEILNFLDRKLQIFEFSTDPHDLETAERIANILKKRKEIERAQRKIDKQLREEMEEEEEEEEEDNDSDDFDDLDDYLAD